ncbi:MAG: hypothetical protein IKH36_02050 [Bacilli bacterium]|nr:hypothetical protein [Bacilli bacterium]
MADQVTGSSTGSTLWKTMNSVGTLATLGAALGISIPALVKANDAQDHEHRHPRDVENDVVYLRSKIYTDNVNFDNYKSQVAYQEATNAKLAALDKENALLKQSQEYGRLFAEQGMANMYQYVNSTFMKGSMYLPATSVNPLPMDRFNSWTAPTAPTVEATSASNG